MKIIITESQYDRVLREDTSEINFRELYSSLWDKVLNTTCRKYTSDIDKARDYCQNGFMKVYKNLHKYKGGGSIEGWVKKVISNNILDELRKEKTQPQIQNYDYDYSRIETPDEPYEEPNVDNIIKVIPMLPPSYRKAFELYYLEGLTHKQIAELLNISVGTSKTNLMKGRNILKQYFKDNPQIDIY